MYVYKTENADKNNESVDLFNSRLKDLKNYIKEIT